MSSRWNWRGSALRPHSRWDFAGVLPYERIQPPPECTLWIFFDVETNGLSIYSARITQIGAVIYDQQQGKEIIFSEYISSSDLRGEFT